MLSAIAANHGQRDDEPSARERQAGDLNDAMVLEPEGRLQKHPRRQPRETTAPSSTTPQTLALGCTCFVWRAVMMPSGSKMPQPITIMAAWASWTGRRSTPRVAPEPKLMITAYMATRVTRTTKKHATQRVIP